MMRLLFTFMALIVTLPVQADFLGNFIDKISGNTSDISPTEATSTTENLNTPATPTIQAPEKFDKLTRAAHIRILDKRTNRLINQTLTTTAPTTVDNITIQVLNCRRHHHQVGHHAAWFTITDVPEDTTTEKETDTPDTTTTPPPPRFEGWMMSAFPEVAALEHPRYDVRLIECKR